VTSPTARRRTGRWLRRVTATVTATTAGSVLLLGSPVPTESSLGSPSGAAVRDGADTDLVLASADGTRWPGHPGRRIVRHTVRPGDTATGLAVRYHAWTRELRALNHLGRHGTLYVGERIRIPVVVAAARKAHRHTAAKPRSTSAKSPRKPVHRVTHPWRLADVSQAKVRRVVVKIARKHGVDPHLALAVAWQESGWQQRRISSAGAIGAMQVLPGTAAWMSRYVGYELNPYGLYDNVTAGVVLLKFLNGRTSGRRAVASYYQGLGSVQDHGFYRSTKGYVRNVVYLRQRMEKGWNPV
jgi:LysM repeat protein